ncbi:IDEAL domain-containing protein [Niallia sp. XMNu-256]|uniref:IDEAL domain-containing protein n=1 Tax=Niallia sp. XMNu-256 TaxID=3082444 RepID=UPI0030CF95FE
MSRLLCEFCGNDNFKMLNEDKALCKYCYRFTNLSVDHKEELEMSEKNIELVHKRQASAITKISLLKRAIDESLDKRDKNEFYSLTFKLKYYQQFLQPKENQIPVNSQEELKQTR